MASDLIIKLAKGEPFTDADLAEELYRICDNVHACCDYECPVYELNGGSVVKTPEKPNGCATFKQGGAMLDFIREHVEGSPKRAI